MAAPAPARTFDGNVIALVWDFDQTMIPGYQQSPLFRRYGVDEAQFWREVGALADRYAAQGLHVSRDTLYLNHLLTYVQQGRMPGLDNATLRQLGQELTFYRGLPGFLAQVTALIENDPRYREHGITVEHYVVSTGLRQMILGSAVAPLLKDVWASEFIEEPAPAGYLAGGGAPGAGSGVISQVAAFIDNTTKTRYIFELNKGSNVDSSIDVNARMDEADRRVPFTNMLYIADGPSDVPVFSLLGQRGGHTLAVYNGASDAHYAQVKQLSDDGRVDHFAEASYKPPTEATRWIAATVRQMADRIVAERTLARRDRIGHPVGHVNVSNTGKPGTGPAARQVG